jgi:hypothetical protein
LPRIAITGHMNLTTASAPLIYREIVDLLGQNEGGDLVGISCIARGADSIFAQAILDLGGKLEVILPAADYRETKVKPDHAEQFDELLRRATAVRVMPFAKASREAYEAANNSLLSSCDRLFAVWDGRSAVDQGGTGAVVEEARLRGIGVDIIWPDGAARA